MDSGKKIKYAFRMTHIDNIPHILQCGIVRSTSPKRSVSYIGIGDSKVISARKSKIVNNISIYDCIPFYFGPRSPMLYVIQNGFNGVEKTPADRIVYCVVRLDVIIRDKIDCLFCDGHALNGLTKFYTSEDLPNLDRIINYDDVNVVWWNNELDIDLKRRKEAELLLLDDLPIDKVSGFVVYNEEAKRKLIDYGVAETKIAKKPSYYF